MRGLAGRTRSCLQEIDELPKEFDVLFERSQFRLLNELGKEAVRLHGALSLKYAALDLINPRFLIPLWPACNLPRFSLHCVISNIHMQNSSTWRTTLHPRILDFGTILKQTLSTDDILESLVAGCVRVSGTNIDKLKSDMMAGKEVSIRYSGTSCV